MKKILVLVIIMTFILCGCNKDSGASARNNGQQSTVSSVIEQQMKQENDVTVVSATPTPVTEPDVQQPPVIPEKIDVDLTELSATMVYSEVYNMMYYPEQYIGKTIKMDGIFSDYFDEVSGNRYFTCIVQDATACCQQGIEFVPLDYFRYPDDYPEANSIICVIGTFDTYTEGDYMYCTLRDAIIL